MNEDAEKFEATVKRLLATPPEPKVNAKKRKAKARKKKSTKTVTSRKA